MSQTAERPAAKTAPATEHIDVLIVGAGISGIGGAYHLATQCPATSFLILEAHPTFGGTWHTHRYPGTRSDSDLYTFGYRFKPWVGAPIATRDQILKYMGEVIAENDLARHIRYNHKITAATWSSTKNQWTVEATHGQTGETLFITTNFLYMCQGYYRHAEGYTPEWDGMETFKGRIIHPQTWPEDLDYTGKNIVVIGSGATAATLVPAVAAKAAHVTLLQRSPTYFIPSPNEDELANTLRALEIDETWIHEIIRRKMLAFQAEITRRSFAEPEALKQELLDAVRAYLGPDFDVATHFTPAYRPWQQRIALLPEGDMFVAIRDGRASVVTDHIDRFTETGILLKSGQTLNADIIVTATGFNMNILGDIDFTIDGAPLNLAETTTYRGMMFTGVPNLVWVFGYFRASWTLRADLVGDFVCRLLQEMRQKHAAKVTVALRPEDAGMPRLPWMDADNFNPNYLVRAMHLLPKRGDKAEWQHTQNYEEEKKSFPAIDLHGPEFVYE